MNNDSIVDHSQPAPSEKSVLRGAASTAREQHWFALIIEWEQSKEPQEYFCQKHNIKVPTFSYWRTRYIAKNKQQPKKTKAFVPVLPEPSAHLTKSKPSEGIQVLLPNGVKLQLPLTMDLKDMLTLINGLGTEHAI